MSSTRLLPEKNEIVGIWSFDLHKCSN